MQLNAYLYNFWFTKTVFCFGLIWIFSLTEPLEWQEQIFGLPVKIFCVLLARKKNFEIKNNKKTKTTGFEGGRMWELEYKSCRIKIVYPEI